MRDDARDLGDEVSRTAKFLAIAFVALEGLAALAMLTLSVHGPGGLAVAAQLYFVVAAAGTWWVAWRFRSAAVVASAGALLVAAAPGVFALLDWRDRRAHERRIAATRVSDVRDEVILSASGRPIGVRVSYAVSVPERGYFAILPSLSSRDRRTDRLRLDAIRWTVDGRSEPTPFEPGRTHVLAVEMYPPLLALMRGEPCLTSAPVPPLPDTIGASPLRVMISETLYGIVHRGAREEVTREAYNLVELYRAVLAEGLTPCRIS